ncbi:ABC transporter [bacterium]|nr:ABC transporter [bacterium]|tara:strand:- start:7813 stop:8553 length:741 start_codon:yes stop_codon:yes gene_type:complete
MNNDTPALEIKELRKTYGKSVAVDDISITLPRGSFLGLLGPNGAGKTTTIGCIVGVHKINGGSIQTFGFDVEKDYRESRKTVGIAPQEFNADFFGKVGKMLDFVAGYYGIPQVQRQKRVEELLEQFNLTKHKEKGFNELSGGLKRRVILARALVHDPELLILDEPTAGVDVELRHELWGYLKKLSEEGKTILLTSHYLDEVELLANRFAFIDEGKIVADGPKEKMLAGGKKLEEVYLELTGKKNAV